MAFPAIRVQFQNQSRTLFSSPFARHSYSSQPLGVGVFAIFVIAAAILLLGDSQAEQSVVRNAGAEHERDLLRFTKSLHDSELGLNGPQVRESIPLLAQTTTFDNSVRDSLFGLRAERVDLYTLEGAPIYSTEGTGNAPELTGEALSAFNEARDGRFMSFFRAESDSQEEIGSNTELLQSFALIRDVPPDSIDSGRSLMVAAITTDVSGRLDEAYATMWLVVAFFFFGSLVVVAVVYWASMRSRDRLQRANDALAEQYAAVRKSRERMIATANETKRAIGEELHGSVQTRIFSIWTRLNRVVAAPGFGAGRQELQEIADELDDVRENDIRGLSHQLHPSIVRVGAAPALRSLCGRLSGDLEIELFVDSRASELEPPGASPIPEHLRLAVFRIAELAISNTIKHANATRCQVFWKYSVPEHALRLIVEDNGVGFDPNRLPLSEFGGLGIVNIQDYTDSVGGTAVLKSEPGWGTTLTVTVPFAPESTPGPVQKPGTGAEVPSNVTPFEAREAA